MPDLPVIVVAFANDQEGHRYLRDLPGELRLLQAILEAAERKRLCELVVRPNASLEQIFEVFTEHRDRVSILHYGGHAGEDRLLLESARAGGGVAHAEGLAAFLGQRRNLELVFLNACSTRAQIAGLLEAGVTAVIATARAIDDQVAREFAVAFYTELAAGATIPAAFEAARGRVRAARGAAPQASFFNRDLIAEAASAGAPADDRGFPWELRLRAGAELAADWSLPDAAGNPLFGLPPLPEQDLPESPFRHLTWFTARDAEVFFGRDHTISELFKQVKEPGRPPILLLHGSSGVGKSSLLDAGLVPRLQGDGIEVRYRRRDPEKGLLRSLLAAFEAAGTAPPSTLADTWRSQEKRLNRPLIVILDQVEETFTKPGPDGARELDDFVAALAEALALRETRPRGKLILGFRKEWFAEIDRRLAEARLPRANLLITQLDRRGIIEAIRGPARPGRLFDHYWLEIEDGLPEVIADGLLSDAGSALAPTLQVLLTNMWKRARDANPARRRFDRDLFESLKAQGYLLQDVLDNGLKALGHWNAESAGSGLPLDFLHYHTTELGTASQHTRAELERHYEHRVALLDGLIGQCKDHYLLIEAQAGADAAEPVPTGTRLAHDLMAPLVQHRWRTSVAPGQRARRVLEHRTAEWKDGKVGNVLDTVDLAIVEAAAEGMRAWTADERRLIEASRLAKKQRKKEEKQREKEEQKRKQELQDSEERRRKAEEKAQGETKKRLWEQEQANRRLRRQRSNLRLSLAATGGVLLIAVMLAVWAVNEKGKAKKNAADYWNETIKAEKNEKEALDASELAGRQRKIAEERQRKADAQRLAALSPLALAEKPQRSLILAVEAIQATRDHGELVVPAAEQELRSALVMVNGSPILRQTSPITALAFAPDGRLVTGSRDGKVQIWDLNDSNARPLDLLGHENQITALAFALDGRLVTSSWDKTARVWDLKKPTSLPVILPHENRIYALAVAPDGRLATGSNDEKARVWDLNRPDAPRLVLPGHEQLIRALAFAPDQRLVTGSVDGTVRVWDLSKPGAPQHILPGHEGEITSLAFATDGRLATASYRTVRVWDLSKPGAPPFVLPDLGSGISALAIAPDGRLVTGGEDGKARVWDLKASNLPPLVLQGHEGEILALVISPQGRLVTGSWDGTVREWDLNQAGADPLVLRGQDKTIDFLAVASDGQLVAVSREGKAQVWDLKRSSDPPFVLPDLGSGISALAIAPDGRLVTGGEDGTTRVWWDLNSSTKPQILPGHKNEITSLALSADGRLATGSKDCSARVWDMKNLAAPPILLPDHGDAVLSLAFAPDGRLATGSSDNKARIWRLQNPTPPPIVLVGQEDVVTALAFAADGRLVTGSEDGTFLVWDLKNADKPFLLPVPAHNREITFLGFAPDGRLVTGSPDEVKVWNLDEVRTAPPIVLSGHEGTITALAFAPDEKLVTASTDRRVRVWDFNLDRLVRLAGKVAGRNLSEEEWEQSFVGEEYRRTFPELPDGAGVPETRPLQKAVGSSNPMVTPPAVTDSEARPRKGQNSE